MADDDSLVGDLHSDHSDDSGSSGVGMGAGPSTECFGSRSSVCHPKLQAETPLSPSRRELGHKAFPIGRAEVLS